jgi:hypothetical protein
MGPPPPSAAILYRGVFLLPFRECMGSLANLFGFQAMSWVYIDVAMQQYAVLRLGSDSSSTFAWSIFATNGPCQYRGVFSLPFRVVGSVYWVV